MNSLRRSYLLAIAAVIMASLISESDAFSTAAYQRHALATHISALFMVAKKGAKKKAKPAKAASGGFGGGTKAVSNIPQVRSVTGHTGSGTKPLRQAANTFDFLRKEFGVEACRDVYVRAPLNDPQTFWFVGKIAIRTDKKDDQEITPEMAIWSQNDSFWNMPSYNFDRRI